MLTTIITPTRNRSVSFGLLEKWIGRQTYSGNIQWIVVNDGSEPYQYHLGQEVLKRQPQNGEIHSLCSNILFALPRIRGEAVIVAEDDDWLAPNYLEKVVEGLGKADLTGSAPAIYYNLAGPGFRVLENLEHCSLGQSAFHARVIPLLEKIAREGDPMIDQKLWRQWTGSRHIFPNSPPIHVGIKSMPGERGIGKGHSMRGKIGDDRSLRQLSRFIGDDADHYRKIFRQFGGHTRTGIINRMIARRGYRSYLEIGLGNGQHFNSVQCVEKESVDPVDGTGAAKPTHRMTSDEFFARNRRRYDLVFIDGLHHCETVYRDICNALTVLSPGGMVVCHDMNPVTEEMQAVPRKTTMWTGDCWKAWVRLRRDWPDLPAVMADTDYGVGVIFPDGKPDGADGMPDDGELTWQNLEHNRQRWLNLVSVETMELWATGQLDSGVVMSDSEDYLLIVGMHRSGTSMLAHLMVKLGCHIGKTVMKPSSDNPEGYFENKAIQRFHDKLLKSMGSSWDDTRNIEPALLEAAMAEGSFSEFASTLQNEFQRRGKRLVKDPRMCRLMPFWTAALGRRGAKSVRCLLPIRHPMNVARSLRTRNGFPISRGLLLWIQNVLTAERDTRGFDRLLIVYDDVLSGKAAPALARFLGLDLAEVEARTAEVAKLTLRHELHSGADGCLRQPLEQLALQVWKLLVASANQPFKDISNLDALWSEYLALQQSS